MDKHSEELARGDRFRFGENWKKFLETVNEEKIEASISGIERLVGTRDLRGKRFVDVGSGSGLSSLAAYRMGAEVYSFDFDPQSVECTQKLKQLHASNSGRWTIARGSALDKAFLGGLGKFHIVYSWGVLHHTGAMWEALANMVPLVADGGMLCIAIYNDQGPWSKRWTRIKKTYNKLPKALAFLFAIVVLGVRELRFFASSLARFHPMRYVRTWTEYRGTTTRGMTKFHDLVDWIGGYPFEVAKPDELLNFYRKHGFVLERMKTCGGGLACNEFVFVKRPDSLAI